METPASIKGHPIHVILVPVPIGLWIFALVADIAVAAGGSPAWSTVAFYSIAGGLVGALLAAVPGVIDLLAVGPGRVRRAGIWHMAINLGAVVLFGANLAIRWNAPEHAGSLLLTLLGVIFIGVSGWLGGELVHVHGVSVVEPGQRPRAGAAQG
jgi:uncharacterized membrane protein